MLKFFLYLTVLVTTSRQMDPNKTARIACQPYKNNEYHEWFVGHLNKQRSEMARGLGERSDGTTYPIAGNMNLVEFSYAASNFSADLVELFLDAYERKDNYKLPRAKRVYGAKSYYISAIVRKYPVGDQTDCINISNQYLDSSGKESFDQDKNKIEDYVVEVNEKRTEILKYWGPLEEIGCFHDMRIVSAEQVHVFVCAHWPVDGPLDGEVYDAKNICSTCGFGYECS